MANILKLDKRHIRVSQSEMLVKLDNFFVFDNFVQLSYRKNGRDFDFLKTRKAFLLLSELEADHSGSKAINLVLVVAEERPLFLKLFRFVIPLLLHHLVWHDRAHKVYFPLYVVKLFIVKAVVGRDQCQRFEQLLAYERLRHVSRYKTTKGAAHQKQGSLLLIYLELFENLEDKQPLVIVRIILMFNHAWGTF